jgi:hypothetical protein
MKKLLFSIMGIFIVLLSSGCITLVQPGGSIGSPPTAYIDSISPPNPAAGAAITFQGHGTDPDGTIVAYKWRSSIDGDLSSAAQFEGKLSAGNHLIYFRVQDNNGNWSPEVSSAINVSGGAPPPSGLPVINTFNANPGSISSGGSSTLVWEVAGASSVSIDQGIGNVAASGTRVVSPGTTTSYTLVATSPAGNVTATTVVSVTGLPPSGQPDLIINDIERDGSTIRYVIRNQGTATAGPSTSLLTVDGAITATDAVGPLAAGASSNESFAFSYTCSLPGDSVAVQADKDNVVVESNEGNNALSESWSCFIIILTPDLIITDISRDGSTIKYTIKNQGSAPSGVSVSQLLVDGVPVATDSVPSLGAGASSNQSFAAYSYSCSGVSDIIQVRADKDGAVTESNEANNTLSDNFGCLILVLYPDLIITDITRSGNTIFYKIKNQGVVAAGATTSRLVIDGAIKANDAVAALAAGQERTESFAFIYSCTAPGDTIQVTADISNAVNEGGSEGNNSRSENYFCP